jgi:hypothetical protein
VLDRVRPRQSSPFAGKVRKLIALDAKGLSHVGDVLRETAEDLPSEVDGIIEQQEASWWTRLGPDAIRRRKVQLLTSWMMGRVRVTGRSWNWLVRRYGLEDWLDTSARDLVCEDGYWRHLPSTQNEKAGT